MPVTPDPYALTNLADVKEHLGIPVATVTWDDKLQRYINAASARIETYIDRKILKRSYTDYYDGRRTNELMLMQWPADKPSELWIDDSSEFTDTDKRLDVAEYEIHRDNYVILLEGRSFRKGVRNIKVVYEAGYTTVPYDLEVATMWHVEWYWDMDNDRSIRQGTKSKNSESATYLTDWPEWFLSHLDPYKRFEFPNSSSSIWNG